MLTVNERDVQCVYCAPVYICLVLNFIHRPTAMLEARRKVVCPVCTIDENRPVMIEQGLEWELHRKTRSHKRLVGKAERGKQVGSASAPP